MVMGGLGLQRWGESGGKKNSLSAEGLKNVLGKKTFDRRSDQRR